MTACLAACGGGGGDSGAPAQSTKTTTPPKVIHIGLFGDSTMVGLNTVAPITHTPTVELQADFDASYGAGRVVVEDMAVSGTNSFQLLDGTDGSNRGPWPAPINDETPAFDIIVINHGMNDMQEQHDVGQYAATLTSLVTMARAAKGNPVVVLETQNPATASPPVGAAWKPLAQPPYVQAMLDVAAQQNAPLVDAYAYAESLPNFEALIPDGVHPGDQLYQQISDNALFPALSKIAKTLM